VTLAMSYISTKLLFFSSTFSNSLCARGPKGSYEGDPIDISKIFQLDNRAAQTYESESEPQAFESIPSTYGDEDICNLPKNEGAMCRGSIPSWFYDIESKKCLGFRYRGCHGNKNRFKSKEKCEETCVHNGKGEESIHRIIDEEIEFYPYKAKTKQTIDNPQCFETAKSRGPCKGHYNRWSYVPKSGKCKQFVYGGCHGSSNNFQTEESCNEKCPHLKIPEPALCSLPPETGRCKAHFTRWYYDPQAGKCLNFIYGGCNGNMNNFKSLAECSSVCFI